jgi:regulatory protein
MWPLTAGGERVTSREAGSGSPAERPDPWEVAVKLLTLRALSTQELRQRLARRGYVADQIRAVVARLTASRYLDDAEYARAWARARARRHSVGPARLAQELRSKGILDTAISAALREAFSERDAGQVAEDAASRKLKALQGLPPEVARRRLGAFLTRQGFTGEVVLALCRKHFPSLDDSENL